MIKPAADPKVLAEACAEAMWERDRASRELGITIERVGPGEAALSMTVREDMVNGHGICHGGFVFALADSAFAFACNTYDRVTVAAYADISYLAPARLGDRLVAHGREVFKQGRNGLYDVTVRLEDGTPIAEFRGRSRAVEGTIIR